MNQVQRENKNRPTGPVDQQPKVKDTKPSSAKSESSEIKRSLSQEEQIDAWFTSHGQSEDQQNRSQAVRAGAKELALIIIKNSQPSADQTAALRKLRELSSTVIQAISLEEVGK